MYYTREYLLCIPQLSIIQLSIDLQIEYFEYFFIHFLQYIPWQMPHKHIILNICLPSHYKYTYRSLSPQILLSPQPPSQSPKSSYLPHLSHCWPRNNNNTPNTQICVTSQHLQIYPCTNLSKYCTYMYADMHSTVHRK